MTNAVIQMPQNDKKNKTEKWSRLDAGQNFGGDFKMHPIHLAEQKPVLYVKNLSQISCIY